MTPRVMDASVDYRDDRAGGSIVIDNAITGLMLVVAVIHLLPITGFFGAKRLSSLYGIDVDSPEVEILMRHRAVLFGILGAFVAYAAFVPELQPLAFVAAAASLASFFYLAVTVGNYTAPIRKIVLADVIAAVCLAGAVLLCGISRATE